MALVEASFVVAVAVDVVVVAAYGIGNVKRRMICDRRASPIFYLLHGKLTYVFSVV